MRTAKAALKNVETQSPWEVEVSRTNCEATPGRLLRKPTLGMVTLPKNQGALRGVFAYDGADQ